MSSSQEARRIHLAIWIVIASEALLFAGLFVLYTAYRSEYPAAFEVGVARDIGWIGGVNTLLLLASSFAIAWAVHAVRSDRTTGARRALLAVIVLGLAFLALKGVEWTAHARDGLVPGAAFAQRGLGLFVTLYFGMTGLHAAHVVAGLVLVTWVTIRVHRRTISADRPTALEVVALYWHFVDVVWVFLWPLFYLMRG